MFSILFINKFKTVNDVGLIHDDKYFMGPKKWLFTFEQSSDYLKICSFFFVLFQKN